jgi:BlaI family penicillinase repressor
MKLSEAEWQIMNALWQQYPASARELTERLPKDVKWAYTTVKTMLSRLVVKNAVSESKRGNTSMYEPLVTRKGARLTAIRNLMNQAFDGAVGSLMHFLVEEQTLSDRERLELIKLLGEEEKKQ